MHRSSAELKLIKPKSAISTAKTSCTEKRHAVDSLANLDPQSAHEKNDHGSGVKRLAPEIFTNDSGRKNGGQNNPLVNQAVHTVGHIDCPACAAVRNSVMAPAADFKNLPFEEAATQWLEERSIRIEPASIRTYRDYITRLKPFFSGMSLARLQQDPWLLASYQRQQKPNYHPNSINHDCNTLLQILERAGIRQEVEKHYEPLPAPDWEPPKVLTEAEESAFFEIASTNKNWAMAYWVATLTNNTTASGKELRMLQHKDIALYAETPFFAVPRNMKNKYRQRIIPLNEEGVEVMHRLIYRAKELGSYEPLHYLFPYREQVSKRYDPNRPASPQWIYRQWHRLVDAAIEKKAISFRLVPHNLRHQSITRMLEAGHPEEVVREIAGHVSREMMLHYSHTRIKRKAHVLDSLVRRKPPGSSGSPEPRGKKVRA